MMDIETEHRQAESRYLEGVRPQYEKQGYDFLVEPALSDLPAFLSGYRPNAIAIKPDSKIAIEVLTRAPRHLQPSIQHIRELFEGHPDWKLVVAYAGGEPIEQLSVPDRKMILRKAEDVRKLAGGEHVDAAFLVAWSLLQAASNLVKPDFSKRPLSPGTVVQALVMDGFVSYETEALLRPLVEQRNRLVHGDLSVEPTTSDVDVVLNAVRETLQDAESGSNPRGHVPSRSS